MCASPGAGRRSGEGFISRGGAWVVAATKAVAEARGGGTIWGGRCCLSQQPSETQAAAPPRKIEDKEVAVPLSQEALVGASAKLVFHGTNL